MSCNLDDSEINELIDLIHGFERRLTNQLKQLNVSICKNYDSIRRNSELILISERRTQCFILNSQIKDARQKFIWPPNYDGSMFGHLADGNRDRRVGKIPANINAIKKADVGTIDSIMEHYDLFQPRQTLTLEEKRSKICLFLGVQIY